MLTQNWMAFKRKMKNGSFGKCFLKDHNITQPDTVCLCTNRKLLLPGHCKCGPLTIHRVLLFLKCFLRAPFQADMWNKTNGSGKHSTRHVRCQHLIKQVVSVIKRCNDKQVPWKSSCCMSCFLCHRCYLWQDGAAHNDWSVVLHLIAAELCVERAAVWNPEFVLLMDFLFVHFFCCQVFLWNTDDLIQ